MASGLHTHRESVIIERAIGAFQQILLENKIKEGAMGKVCSMHREMKIRANFWLKSPKGTDHMGTWNGS
jgi:hypothetical protein